ncbi:MOSC domain-containing protein [Brachyspira hampsonii 30446]|uniref:MOSC domain-containing protein n=1 Tax=Brachyspira hampsonii 30446 TaxID=1289135 RepID=A0A2U4EY42_9SPIR|nr:MOSC domain-containing protein [Brachyspira hampsonii]EKV56262.1 MOSC domain-containing protein [Brachyspira hampsonii 30446]MBW5393792.1 MOSC domain-containing protein [Brachyspira hampsonii]OEJ17145.1 molybdenum cofactor sulfurase [Brachyspira hampsonii]
MEKKYFKLISLNISKETGTIKTPVESITLVEDKGVLNDAHFNKLKDRQVSLLAIEDIEYTNDKMQANLKPGDFAENITTKDIELYKLPIGTKMYIGDTIVEVSKIGKACHNGCDIKQLVGDCIMPKKGIFVRVVKGGEIKIEDTCYYCV